MKGYYELTSRLFGTLNGYVLINQVTKGSLDKITNAKKDMYPLAHVMVDNGVFESNTIKFTVSVLVMDLIDYTKDNLDDLYYGNNNEDDVHHQSILTCQRLFEDFRRGQYSEEYSIESDSATFELFTERFTDDVAGCTMTFDITMANEMTIC
jgi:hypothetical protein